MKILIGVLVILTVGLGIGLMVRHDQAVKERTQNVAQITDLSDQLKKKQSALEEQVQVNTTLSTNISLREAEIAAFSNRVEKVVADLVKTQGDLKSAQEAAKAAAEAAAAAIAQKDAKIQEMGKVLDTRDKELATLNNNIAGLEKLIDDTKKKLATSEGDRTFLLKELKRLQEEKALLEKQFNDLAVLRDQVRKLKEELSVARRLDMIKKGLYDAFGQKGGEILNRGVQAPSVRTNANSAEFELRKGGTNAPPAQ